MRSAAPPGPPGQVPFPDQTLPMRLRNVAGAALGRGCVVAGGAVAGLAAPPDADASDPPVAAAARRAAS